MVTPCSLHDDTLITMNSSYDAEVPYTLLGFLLRGGSVSSDTSDGRSFDFFHDYLTRGTNAILWILLISATSVLLNKLCRIFRLWVLGARIPGPPALSLFRGCFSGDSLCGSGGNLDLTGYLSKLHENYGPIVRLWFGPSNLFISVKDNTLIKEILIKTNDKLPLTERAYNLAFGTLSLFVSSFNDNVKERRESLSKYLNNKFIPRNLIETLIERTESIISEGLMDCKYLSQYMAFNILGTTLFGENFLYWDNLIQYQELVMKVSKEGFFWASYIIPPIWKREYWIYRSHCETLKGLTLEIVEISVRNPKFNFEEVIGFHYSKNEVCGNILAIMLHGCVTSANLISNILTRLVISTDLQEKIYSEICEVMKESCDTISLNDVKIMRFLLATVFESVRLVPAGPFIQRCSLNSDVKLENGITIPAGATVVVPLNLVQMDTSLWGKDALQFNPDRFLSSDSNLDVLEAYKDSNRDKETNKSKRNESLFSFGSGTRACVGQKFAILSIASSIASLIYSYKLQIKVCHKDDFVGNQVSCQKITMTKRNLE